MNPCSYCWAGKHSLCATWVSAYRPLLKDEWSQCFQHPYNLMYIRETADWWATAYISLLWSMDFQMFSKYSCFSEFIPNVYLSPPFMILLITQILFPVSQLSTHQVFAVLPPRSYKSSRQRQQLLPSCVRGDSTHTGNTEAGKAEFSTWFFTFFPFCYRLIQPPTPLCRLISVRERQDTLVLFYLYLTLTLGRTFSHQWLIHIDNETWSPLQGRNWSKDFTQNIPFLIKYFFVSKAYK